MVIYNISTNGTTSQMIIEVINDSIYIEATSIAYVEGDLALNAKPGGIRNRFKAYFIGKKFFKPVYTGTGKIYTKPTNGVFHKFTLKENEELIVNNSAFVACRQSLNMIQMIKPSLMNFLSGAPIIYNLIQGSGNIVVKVPGTVKELQLVNGKFVAYANDVAAYSSTLKLTREPPGSGWLSIVHQLVHMYRGTGSVYFSPHPNKDSKPLT